MKLMMENWRKFLNEEMVGADIVGYHGTVTGPNLEILMNFREIDSGLSAGMAKEQGAGFYLFSSKKRTIKRLFGSHAVPDVEARGMLGMDTYMAFEKELHGWRLLVTLKVPYDINNIAIDYEVSYDNVVEFFLKHIDRIANFADGELFSDQKEVKGGIELIFNPNLGFPVKKLRLVKGLDSGTARLEGNIVNQIVRWMQNGDLGPAAKGIGRDFLGEIIAKSPAFKYVGSKIEPTKLEIVLDNKQLIDVTKEVLSGNIEKIKDMLVASESSLGENL